MGYILRIHGQECNSFRRKTRAKSLQEFKLHRQEKFLYVCDALNRWEWDVQVLDIEDGIEKGDTPSLPGRPRRNAARVLRRPNGISADAETATRRQCDAGAEDGGSWDSDVDRVESRHSGRHLEFAAYGGGTSASTASI
jgi:hypothetical protein